MKTQTSGLFFHIMEDTSDLSTFGYFGGTCFENHLYFRGISEFRGPKTASAMFVHCLCPTQQENQPRHLQLTVGELRVKMRGQLETSYSWTSSDASKKRFQMFPDSIGLGFSYQKQLSDWLEQQAVRPSQANHILPGSQTIWRKNVQGTMASPTSSRLADVYRLCVTLTQFSSTILDKTNHCKTCSELTDTL